MYMRSKFEDEQFYSLPVSSIWMLGIIEAKLKAIPCSLLLVKCYFSPVLVILNWAESVLYSVTFFAFAWAGGAEVLS